MIGAEKADQIVSRTTSKKCADSRPIARQSGQMVAGTGAKSGISSRRSNSEKSAAAEVISPTSIAGVSRGTNNESSARAMCTKHRFVRPAKLVERSVASSDGCSTATFGVGSSCAFSTKDAAGAAHGASRSKRYRLNTSRNKHLSATLAREHFSKTNELLTRSYHLAFVAGFCSLSPTAPDIHPR